jgi:hypothetical protein
VLRVAAEWLVYGRARDDTDADDDVVRIDADDAWLRAYV